MISRSTAIALTGMAIGFGLVATCFALTHDSKHLQAKADKLFLHKCSTDRSIDCLLSVEEQDPDLAAIGSQKL